MIHLCGTTLAVMFVTRFGAKALLGKKIMCVGDVLPSAYVFVLECHCTALLPNHRRRSEHMPNIPMNLMYAERLHC